MSLRIKRGINSDFTLNNGNTRRFDEGEPVFNTTNNTLHIGKGLDSDPVVIGATNSADILDIVDTRNFQDSDQVVAIVESRSVDSEDVIEIIDSRPSGSGIEEVVSTVNVTSGNTYVSFDLDFETYSGFRWLFTGSAPASGDNNSSGGVLYGEFLDSDGSRVAAGNFATIRGFGIYGADFNTEASSNVVGNFVTHSGREPAPVPESFNLVIIAGQIGEDSNVRVSRRGQGTAEFRIPYVPTGSGAVFYHTDAWWSPSNLGGMRNSQGETATAQATGQISINTATIKSIRFGWNNAVFQVHGSLTGSAGETTTFTNVNWSSGTVRLLGRRR